MSQFSERLHKLRKEGKIRQQEFGTYLGYGATAIVHYESGRNEAFLDSLIKLAEYFGVSVGYLIGSESEAGPEVHSGAALSAEEAEGLLFPSFRRSRRICCCIFCGR